MKLRSLFLACMISVLGIGCQLTPTFTTGYQVDPGRLRSAPVPEKEPEAQPSATPANGTTGCEYLFSFI